MFHNLVSVHHKSMNLGQVTNLILSCLVVVSVYWLVEIWNWPHSLLNSEVAHMFVSWHRVLSRVVLKAVLEPCTEPKIWLLSVCIIWSNQSLYITSLLEGNATSLCCSCHSTDSIFIWTPPPPPISFEIPVLAYGFLSLRILALSETSPPDWNFQYPPRGGMNMFWIKFYFLTPVSLPLTTSFSLNTCLL